MRETKKAATLVVIACLLFSVSSFGELVLEVPEAAGTPAPAISVPAPSDGAGGNSVSEAADSKAADQLLFVNKDGIHGKLASFSGEKFGLEWLHEHVDRPIRFSLDNVSMIKLSGRTVAADTTGARITSGRTVAADTTGARITLSNDDSMIGKIVSLDSEKLVVDTWYAGRMNIEKVMVKAIHPNTRGSSSIYEGPSDIANWTMQNHGNNIQGWSFKNGALYALQPYPIGRMIDSFPDSFDIEFEVAWRGYPQFMFAFLTDNLQQYYGNCYMLQVSNTSVHMHKYNRNGNQQSLGSATVSQFTNTGKGKAKLNIMVDKKNKTIALLVNDTLVKQFPASPGFDGLGKGILFQPQSQGNLKISKIRISSWGGKLPSAVSSGEGEGNEDTIRFVNGDKVSGSLLSIVDGIAEFKTSYATLTVPVKRIASAEMSPENTERARRNKSDVKASFATGGGITLQLSSIQNSQLKGSSENFGMVTMPVGAFESVEFNIYREKEEDEDDDFDL